MILVNDRFSFLYIQCQQEKRKTINGDDLLWAMSTLGFDKYVEPLKLYLQKYREAMKGDKGGKDDDDEDEEEEEGDEKPERKSPVHAAVGAPSSGL
jgi:hypothetical protein